MLWGRWDLGGGSQVTGGLFLPDSLPNHQEVTGIVPCHCVQWAEWPQIGTSWSHEPKTKSSLLLAQALCRSDRKITMLACQSLPLLFLYPQGDFSYPNSTIYGTRECCNILLGLKRKTELTVIQFPSPAEQMGRLKKPSGASLVRGAVGTQLHRVSTWALPSVSGARSLGNVMSSLPLPEWNHPAVMLLLSSGGSD